VLLQSDEDLTSDEDDAYTSDMRRLAPDHLTRACAGVVADCACEGLRRTARAVSKVYAGALSGLGLTPTQMAILVATRLHGSLPLSRLAQGLGLDRTSLYRAVRPLERRGYLRTTAGRTERERVATVTPKGEQVLQQALPIWKVTQRRFRAALGERTWRTLGSATRRVLAAAQTLSSSGERERPRRRPPRT
jgi:DNA-binding MarR family transcriptional regulator